MPKQYRTVRGGTQICETNNWTPFLRQLHMSSCVWILYFMHGLCTGAPTVFIPQIRREWNATVTVDDELASWFYSTSNLASLPWIFMLPALSKLLGRKLPYLACCAAMFICFILLYFSSAPYHILIAEGIHGFVCAGAPSILIYIIPEYCHHRYRTMYLNIQCTCFYWGMWVSNAIGTFVSWKYIPILGLICTLYSFTVTLYPESPRWLASKGKLTESEAAHRWLFGSSPDAERELRDYIKSQEQYSEDDHKMTCSRFMKTLTYKPFYMPVLLVILVGAQYNFSGKFICSIYAIDILNKVTKNENAAYTGMLILDGVTVLGMYVGCILSKIVKMRTLLLRLCFLSICVMFMFSLYLYLAKLEIIQENNIVSLSFLTVYSLALTSGPVVICLSIYGELISIRYQVVSYIITSLVFLSCCTGMLKFSPLIFKGLGIHGSFLFFGIASTITTTLLYLYLPETKNKTLEEIEEYFKDTVRLPETETLTKPVDSGVID